MVDISLVKRNDKRDVSPFTSCPPQLYLSAVALAKVDAKVALPVTFYHTLENTSPI